MSKDWYIMTPPQQKNSGFESQEFLDYAQDYLNEVLEETFLGVNVVIYKDGNLDEATAIYAKAIVQDNTPVRESSFDKRQLITRIGFQNIGNYVKFEGDIYLITEPPGNNQMYEKGWMQLCNCNIGWINDDGNEVWRKSIFRDSTRYSSGESENKSLVLGDMRIEILMSKDNETIKIPRDKRFIVDDYERSQILAPMVYKVTKTNLVEKHKKGNAVLIFIMAEDSFNLAKDNSEKMIADYYEFANKYFLELTTPEFVQVEQGNTFQIQSVAKINNNIATNGIVYISDDEKISSVNENGVIEGLNIGTNHIKVIFNQIERNIEVCVVESKSVIQQTTRIGYKGAAELRLGSSAKKTFTANFFDGSGEPMNDIAVWNIYDDKCSSIPPYITIVSQTNNSISLRAHGNINLIGEKVYLKLTGTSGFAENILEIPIVGLT